MNPKEAICYVYIQTSGFDEDTYISGDTSNYKINTEDAKTGGQSYYAELIVGTLTAWARTI